MSASVKKIGMRMAILAAVSLVPLAGIHAAEVLRAHYEIVVAGKSGLDSKIRSTFEAKPGESVRVEVPPNVVEMSVERTIADQYQLEVTVLPKSGASAGALFKHVYQGKLGQPLELKSSSDALKVDGAISVVILNK